MFQTKVVEEVKTHILYSITFSRKFCRVYSNAGKRGRIGKNTRDRIIWRRKDTICVLHNYGKNTDTHTQNTCYLFSTTSMVTRTRLSVTSERPLPVLFLREFSMLHRVAYVSALPHFEGLVFYALVLFFICDDTST